MNAPVRTSSTAIVSLVAGILSWFILPFVGAVVAIIAGHMARSEIRRERIDGDGMAVAGLILGYLNLLLSAAALLILFGVLGIGVLAAMIGIAA